MPDIAMCNNKECPSKDLCYRHRAVMSERQSMATFLVEPGEDKCLYFWPIHPSHKLAEVKDATER